MKILFFCARFYPEIGGVEKHVYELSRQLIKQGHAVMVITESFSSQKHKKVPSYQTKHKSDNSSVTAKKLDKSALFNYESLHGIEIIRLDFGKQNWFKKFRIWKAIWNIRYTIFSSDIIHCHDVFFWYFPFRFLHPNKKVYVTFHGYESYPLPKKNIFIHKLSEKLSNGNICIGDFIKKWYGTKPSFISYGAVDVNKFKVKNSKFKVKEKSAVFVGRLDEQTCIDMYCNAVSIVKKYSPEFQFIVAGDGKFRNLAEKRGNVLGFQKNPERLFEKYHFAFVSRYLSILEALVAKRLVFAVYDNPIKKDYLLLSPFSKYIVTAGSSKVLAEKILYYIDHPEEEKTLIEKGHQYAVKQTWPRLVKNYLTMWDGS